MLSMGLSDKVDTKLYMSLCIVDISNSTLHHHNPKQMCHEI